MFSSCCSSYSFTEPCSERVPNFSPAHRALIVPCPSFLVPSSLLIPSSLPASFFSCHVPTFRPLPEVFEVKMTSRQRRKRESTSPKASSRPELLPLIPEGMEVTSPARLEGGPSRAGPWQEPSSPSGSEALIAETPSRRELAAVHPWLEPKQAALLWRCGIAFEDTCCSKSRNDSGPRLKGTSEEHTVRQRGTRVLELRLA